MEEADALVGAEVVEGGEDYVGLWISLYSSVRILGDSCSARFRSWFSGKRPRSLGTRPRERQRERVVVPRVEFCPYCMDASRLPFLLWQSLHKNLATNINASLDEINARIEALSKETT